MMLTLALIEVAVRIDAWHMPVSAAFLSEIDASGLVVPVRLGIWIDLDIAIFLDKHVPLTSPMQGSQSDAQSLE
jgi:hypothetical protein